MLEGLDEETQLTALFVTFGERTEIIHQSD